MTKKRVLNKEKVIEAAFQLVNSEGRQALAMPNLAKKLGVRSQSLYNHITNLDDVTSGMTIYFFKELKEVLLEDLLGLSGKEAVLQYFHSFRKYCKEHLRLAYILFDPSGIENQAVIEARHDVTSIYKKLIVSYIEDPHQGRIFSHALMSTLTGYIMMESSGYFTDITDADNMFDEIIAMITTNL